MKTRSNNMQEDIPLWARSPQEELKGEFKEIEENVGNSPPGAKNWNDLINNLIKELKHA